MWKMGGRGYIEKRKNPERRTIMLGVIIGFGLLTIFFWLCFKFTSAIFSILFWLFIKLPCAIALAVLGAVFCVTILLIPVGKGCFNLAWELLT